MNVTHGTEKNGCLRSGDRIAGTKGPILCTAETNLGLS